MLFYQSHYQVFAGDKFQGRRISQGSGQLGEKAKKVVAKLNKDLNNELSFYSMNKVSNRLVKLQVNIILDLIELVKHAESIYHIHNSFNKDTLQG